MRPIKYFIIAIFLFLVGGSSAFAQQDSTYHFVYVDISSMPGGAKLVHHLDSLQKEFEQENVRYTFFLSNLSNPEIYSGKGDFESWLGTVSSLEPPPTNFNSDLNLILNQLSKNEFAEISQSEIKAQFKSVNFHFFISARDFSTQNSRYYLIDKLLLAINTNKMDKKLQLNLFFPVKETIHIKKEEVISFYKRRNVKTQIQFL
jgi:hypothetical protein